MRYLCTIGSIVAFEDIFNPLTGCGLFQTFFVSIMLYEFEILSESHLDILEYFQAEVWKWILGHTRYHNNICAVVALHWLSVKAGYLFAN